MKTLWWNLEGEKTQAFCPVALAFIRWRLQWEGKRIPASLDDGRQRGHLYGLVGWISKDAPIFSANWSATFEAWVNAHLLAVACFDSFAQWVRISENEFNKNSVGWTLNEHEHFMTRHWACGGRGLRSEPGLLFIEPQAAGSIAQYRPVCNRAHLRTTLSSLAMIRR
ncbi:hypothetical protein C5F53_18035 [Rhodoferax sp. TS-BS-61-7]|nr:hypothetical protein C5F53_18035 [Rhodoferax sp. TS-BS-61-7]